MLTAIAFENAALPQLPDDGFPPGAVTGRGGSYHYGTILSVVPEALQRDVRERVQCDLGDAGVPVAVER
jgi:hypothetical protein